MRQAKIESQAQASLKMYKLKKNRELIQSKLKQYDQLLKPKNTNYFNKDPITKGKQILSLNEFGIKFNKPQ